jgi:uncharacterized membrane protein
MVPLTIIVFSVMIVIFLAPLLMIPLQGNEPNPVVFIVFVAFAAILGILIFCTIVLLNLASTFVYPLIVDRKLSGVDAARLSTRASFANFWQLIGLLLLNAVLSLAGALLCYVGLFLVLPVSFASISIAYSQVFGLGRIQSSGPPAPPVFSRDLN